MHDWNEECPPPWAQQESEPVEVQVERAIARARRKRFEIRCEEDVVDDPKKPYRLV